MFDFDNRYRGRYVNTEYELYKLKEKERDILEMIEHLQDPQVIGEYQQLLNKIVYAKYQVERMEQARRQ